MSQTAEQRTCTMVSCCRRGAQCATAAPTSSQVLAAAPTGSQSECLSRSRCRRSFRGGRAREESQERKKPSCVACVTGHTQPAQLTASHSTALPRLTSRQRRHTASTRRLHRRRQQQAQLAESPHPKGRAAHPRPRFWIGANRARQPGTHLAGCSIDTNTSSTRLSGRAAMVTAIMKRGQDKITSQEPESEAGLMSCRVLLVVPTSLQRLQFTLQQSSSHIHHQDLPVDVRQPGITTLPCD